MKSNEAELLPNSKASLFLIIQVCFISIAFWWYSYLSQEAATNTSPLRIKISDDSVSMLQVNQFLNEKKMLIQMFE